MTYYNMTQNEAMVMKFFEYCGITKADIFDLYNVLDSDIGLTDSMAQIEATVSKDLDETDEGQALLDDLRDGMPGDADDDDYANRKHDLIQLISGAIKGDKMHMRSTVYGDKTDEEVEESEAAMWDRAVRMANGETFTQ